MTPFGIFQRPRRNRFDEDPNYAPIEEPLGIVPRDQRDSPAPAPAISRQQLPGIFAPPLPSSSGRIAESPNQPASSSIGSNVVDQLSETLTGTGRRQTPQQGEYDHLSRTPAKDKNGRLKSAIWNALLQMSEGANQALRSGRPIDEYALAGVAGRGIGGAGGGAFNPSVDEEHKRQMRMGDLEQQIGQQIKIEQAQAQTDRIQSEAEYNRERPGIEARKLAQKSKPKRFIIGGKTIDYRPRVDEAGEPVLDADGAPEWEPYEATVKDEKPAPGTKPIQDASKIPDADGQLPFGRLRAKLSEEQIAARQALAILNNKFKAEENAKDRRFKAGESVKDRGFKARESAEDRSIKRAELSEKIYARMVRDKIAGQKVQISIANARTQAARANASLDDYMDALSANGVEVTPK